MGKTKEESFNIVRIYGTDIKDSLSIFYGLAKIKGISYLFSNAVCCVLGLDKRKKISSLSDEQIEKIEEYLENPKNKNLPDWLLNHRFDPETGKDLHFAGKDLDFVEIKTRRRATKLKTYKGQRLRLGLPLRGQRTKSNFRKNKTKASMKAKAMGKK
jgi:small subunit ribosomal protein S13